MSAGRIHGLLGCLNVLKGIRSHFSETGVTFEGGGNRRHRRLAPDLHAALDETLEQVLGMYRSSRFPENDGRGIRDAHPNVLAAAQKNFLGLIRDICDR